MKQIPCALTIAGTDPSGGAGIQADLKTFQELKSYGMSVVTSVVAQNTTGVTSVHHLPSEFLSQQLKAVSDDMPIHAFKTGMIATSEMMKVIGEWVDGIQAPFVMDPVMVTQSGHSLIEQSAQQFLKEQLVPRTHLVTPNIPETEVLLGETITSKEDMREAAYSIVEKLGTGAALIKGGHLKGKAIDFLYDGNRMHEYESERIDSTNTHGTGCTYSAAITAYLSEGHALTQAVKQAKYFVTEAIRHSFDLGKGSGPTNHFALRGEVFN